MADSDDVLKLENQLCFPFYAVSRLITRHYQPLLEKLNLTYPQYLVLLVLWERQSSSVTELSRILLLNSNTLTPLLKRLAAQGYIERTRSDEDERRVMISLTERGWNLRKEALGIPEKLVASLEYSEEDLIALKKLIDPFLEALKK
ncbi:MarR family transcriptional regulator [Marispirochaeta aestuarii]|uniref:MarR family transcriptional regulator n=1 Tax=Marispirochaeta aestuarii TaxID=1963862 RepID=A0A1Y1S2B2_9SPIO|nr:MarR family transcriptional regulator [Marispirochaeta aestuarii]ORC36937.1 MarR family transcriptional regulator [Marispirochaeta aestuarii]